MEFGPTNLTSWWPPIDQELPKTVKDRAVNRHDMQGWPDASAAHRRTWTKRRFGAKLKRQLKIQLVLKAYGKINGDEFAAMRAHCWQKTGLRPHGGRVRGPCSGSTMGAAYEQPQP